MGQGPRCTTNDSSQGDIVLIQSVTKKVTLLLKRGRQWQNLLGCDHWVLAGPLDPKQFGFCGLVRVIIAELIGCILAGLALAGKLKNEINICQAKKGH